MPRTERRGIDLHYETDGSGETVTFVGDAGYGAWQWSWQYGALAGPYRTVVLDHRGTGGSDAPPGPYSVSELAADLEAVLGAAEVRRTHLVGAGLGGMVALAYAREYGRARGLALCSTATHGEDIDATACRDLEAATSQAFRQGQPDVLEGIREWREREDAGERGWTAQAAAVEAFDARDWLHELTLPALVFHGTADAVWPPGCGEALAVALPRGEFVPLDGAGHLAWVEHSRVVNDHLAAFLEE